MAKRVKVDDMDNAMMDIFNEYLGTCDKYSEEAIKLTAKEAVQELKNANPAGSGKYGSWKDYNKGWTVTRTKTDIRYHRTATIHNKDHYQLTHLLEKGHALPQGGRSAPYKHIEPVANKCEEELLRRMKNL